MKIVSEDYRTLQMIGLEVVKELTKEMDDRVDVEDYNNNSYESGYCDGLLKGKEFVDDIIDRVLGMSEVI